MMYLNISKKYKAKLEVPQITKGQRRIFKIDTRHRAWYYQDTSDALSVVV